MNLKNSCRLVSASLLVISVAILYIPIVSPVKWVVWVILAIFVRHSLSHYWTDNYLTYLADNNPFDVEVSFKETKQYLHDNIFEGMLFAKVCSGLYSYAYIIDCRSKNSIVNLNTVTSKMKSRLEFLRTIGMYQAGMYLSYNLFLVLTYFTVLVCTKITIMNVITVTFLFVPIEVALHYGTLHCSIIRDVYKTYLSTTASKGGVKIR